jgi:hypothetical protein
VAARIMDRAALLSAGLIVIGALGRPIPSVAAQADAHGLWHAP